MSSLCFVTSKVESHCKACGNLVEPAHISKSSGIVTVYCARCCPACRPVETLPVSPARDTDPETAHEAAGDSELRGKQRLAVLEYLIHRGPHGATDYETGDGLGILRTSAGKRRKELETAGLVTNSGVRRPTDTNSTAIVWIAVEKKKNDG